MQQHAPYTAPPQHTLLAIILFCAGLSLGAFQSGLGKMLTSELPVLLIIWGRYVGYFVLVFPLTLWRHGRSTFSIERPRLQLLRALVQAGGSLCFLAALIGAPLADATAILFVYPFLVTAMAPVFLGDRLRASHWIAVSLGCVGVVVVMRPGLSGVSLYSLLALTAGSTYAAQLVLTRQLTGIAPPLVTGSVTAAVGLGVFSLLLPWVWQPLTLFQVSLLIGIGVSVTMGQQLTIAACDRAQLSTLAPFGYFEIVAAALVSLLLFHELPDAVASLGIAIIIATGLYIALTLRRAGPGSMKTVSRSQNNNDAN